MVSDKEYTRVCKELAELISALNVPEGVKPLLWARALRALRVRSDKELRKVQRIAMELAEELAKENK